MKIKIRFFNNCGRHITSDKMLKAILPAIWDEGDREEVINTVSNYVSLLNDNKVFFYPFPLNLNRTRFLDIHITVCYHHFAWDLPEEDIHPYCEICRDWDLYKLPAPEKPFFMQGSICAYICQYCQNIIVDDANAGKSGMITCMSKRQFQERFGIEPPIPLPGKEDFQLSCYL